MASLSPAHIHPLLLALLASFLFLACERQVEDVIIDEGYEYFPLRIGQNWEYEVDSITLRPVVNGTFYDSVHLYAREQLTDTFRDGAGQLWFLGERHERLHDSLPWRYRLTFALSHDAQRAWRREDNLDFIKLTFPVKDKNEWDGNAAFDAYQLIPIGGELMPLFKEWNYQYTSVNMPGEVNGVPFDSLLTVELVNYENLIEYRYATEQYARGIGLVYREMVALDTQCQTCCNGNIAQCIDLPWRTKAEKGFILRQRLKKS